MHLSIPAAQSHDMHGSHDRYLGAPGWWLLTSPLWLTQHLPAQQQGAGAQS
jgi:hypothetical protein